MWDKLRGALRGSPPETSEPAPKLVVHVPHADSARAEVIPREEAGPRLITMYRDGTPVEVPITEIPKFEALGFLLHKPEDLVALAREVGTLANLLYPLMMKLTDAVAEDGVIDPNEEGHYHALTKTFNLVGRRLQNFTNVLFQNYPVKEK